MPPERQWLSWMHTLETVANGAEPTESLLDDCLSACLSSDTWSDNPDLTDLYAFLARCWVYPALRLKIEAACQYWSKERKRLLEQCVTPFLATSQNGQAPATFANVKRVSANALRAQEFPPLKWFASGLLHEGNCIFAGKSKRGKSWLAFNIAISLALGDDVLGHYEVPYPVKVAYCALEDGDRRMNRRIKQIEASRDLSNLEIVFAMPKLAEGGYDFIEHLIAKEGFQVVIIDVLAKVDDQGKSGPKGYQEVYDTLGRLHELRNKHTFALIMITHLRKAEAEEVSEQIMGSMAYVGIQDVVWVFQRKYGDNFGYLEVLDKDMAEKSIEIEFKEAEGLWTFVGEGDEHAASKEEFEILQYLREETKPQSIKQIMEGIGMPAGKFSAFRKRLQRMEKDHKLLRTDRGMYAAFGRGGWEDLDEPPF